MVMCQSSRVHQHPPFLGVLQSAVVPYEPAPAPFIVNAGIVQCNVYGISRAVMVRPQERLFVRPVPDHEVHQRSRRLNVLKKVIVRIVFIMYIFLQDKVDSIKAFYVRIVYFTF